MDNISKNYSVVLALNNHFPTIILAISHVDLVQEYKDAVIGEKKFLTWDKGCFEMTHVLGVYTQ